MVWNFLCKFGRGLVLICANITLLVFVVCDYLWAICGNVLCVIVSVFVLEFVDIVEICCFS